MHPWSGPGVADKPAALLPLSWGLGLEWLADEAKSDRGFHEVVQTCPDFVDSGPMQEGVIHMHEEQVGPMSFLINLNSSSSMSRVAGLALQIGSEGVLHGFAAAA